MIIFINFLIMNLLLNFLQLLSNLRNDDLSMEKVTFTRLNSKLAHVNSRISFLLDCRSSNLTPVFILYKTPKLNYVPNHPLANKVVKLRISMLNEEIKSAFRKKAFLQRSLDRSADVLQRDKDHWSWLHHNCKLIFADELRSVQQRLLKKLDNLSVKQYGRHLNLNKTRTYKHVNWLIQKITKDTNAQLQTQLTARTLASCTTEPVSSPACVSLDSTTTVSKCSSPRWFGHLISIGRLCNTLKSCLFSIWNWILARFFRLTPTSIQGVQETYFETQDGSVIESLKKPSASSPPTTFPATCPTSPRRVTQPRLVNLTQHALNPSTADILEKGPSFALSQKITPKIMSMVEVGIERAFYAMKWATYFEDRKGSIGG